MVFWFCFVRGVSWFFLWWHFRLQKKFWESHTDNFLAELLGWKELRWLRKSGATQSKTPLSFWKPQTLICLHFRLPLRCSAAFNGHVNRTCVLGTVRTLNTLLLNKINYGSGGRRMTDEKSKALYGHVIDFTLWLVFWSKHTANFKA